MTAIALALCMVVTIVPGIAFAQSYLDITLDRAISVALEKNKDVVSAREDAIKAGLQITEAASAAYPQINGSWTMDRNLKPQVFVISFPDSNGNLQKNRLKVGTDHTMNIGANLTQPIWVGGKVGTALKAAKIYKKLSDETFKAVKQNIANGVASSFYGILLSEEMVRITRESLSLAEKHLDNVMILKNAGAATEYDLLRARVNVENLRPDVIEAENNVNVSLLRFRDILGVDPTTPVTVNGVLDRPDTTLFRFVDSRTALDRRPDFKAAGYGVDLQEKAVRIAYGDFLPTLSAGTTFAFSGNFDTFKYNPVDWNPYWFANISLTFPLFSGFKNYSKYQQAKVDHRKAEIDLRKTRDTIIIEIDENAMQLRKAIQLIESREMNVGEAAKAVELAESLYKNGKATQLEVLDAQLALEVSKNNLATALYNGKVAEMSLRKALGLLDIDS